jgi:oxygen-dependent protoporphyrinogen oxidase
MNPTISKGDLSTNTPLRVAILGGGISGLSLAYFLKKRSPLPLSITIFEKAFIPGGWIRTSVEEGFFFEKGPRSLRGQDSAETVSLLRELGLEDQLVQAPPEAYVRYLYRQGRLEKVPASLFEALRSPLTRPFIGTMVKELFRSKGGPEDESIFAFFERRFSTPFAETFIDPMLKGIFAGDSRKLSMRAAFPKLKALEESHGSLIKGMLFAKKTEGLKGIYGLKSGMGSLIDSLQMHLKDEIQLANPVLKIEKSGKGIQLETASGTAQFDRVISTLPAHALQAILPPSTLKDDLKEIPFASVAVCTLGYKERVNRYPGFGYLVPSSENQGILGVVFDSSAFPFHNRHPEETRMTVMLDPLDMSQKACLDVAIRTVNRHLGIEKAPDFAKCTLAKQAIAQYPVGFPGLLKKMEQSVQEFPGLSFLGTSFHGISVNQAISASMHYKLSKNDESPQN